MFKICVLLGLLIGLAQACTHTYTIQSGNTCWDIWTKSGLTEIQFYSLNPGINCGNLAVGQVVCVAYVVATTTSSPVTYYPLNSCSSNHVVQSGETCQAIILRYGLSLSQFSALNPAINCNYLQVGALICVQAYIAPTTTVAPFQCSYPYTAYTVRDGDSCELFMKFYGMSWDRFVALNPSVNCYPLQVGTSVCLDTYSPATSTVAPIVVSTTVAPIVVSTTVAPTVVSTTAAPIVFSTTAAPIVFSTTVAPIVFSTTVAPATTAYPTTVFPYGCNYYYTVQPGDYCWLIYSNNKVDANMFYYVNPNLDCNNLRVGQTVCLSNASGPLGCRYAVQAGESCWSIYSRYGYSSTYFQSINPLMNCNNLQIGQIINVC